MLFARLACCILLACDVNAAAHNTVMINLGEGAIYLSTIYFCLDYTAVS